MSDIVEVSGLNKSSLYNAFGSKQELFALVLERYINARMEQLSGWSTPWETASTPSTRSSTPIKAEVDSEFGRQGCLAVNTSAEMGASDTAIQNFGEHYRGQMRSCLVDVVTKATTKSGLDQALIEPRADMLLVFMLGVSVTVRSGAGCR